ncbi:MAG: nuclear transport factor 2 family protein [Pseudomonadota bacterium]
MSEEPVLLRFCTAWQQQRLDAALENVRDDVAYTMFIPRDVVPFGGETIGKAAMKDRLRTILEQFEMLRFDARDFRGSGSIERVRVAYSFRHRVTGETIVGIMRLVVRTQDDLIAELKEYHDVEKVRAFMRLVAYKAAGCTLN